MADRFLVKSPAQGFSEVATIKVSFVALCLICSFLFSVQVNAEQRQHIRFYKINKIEQTTRMMFADKKGKKAGCHNSVKKTRVYRVNQLGYASCRLYSKKDCASDALIEVNRKKDETPVTELTQGYSWHPISDHARGVKLRSWDCKGMANGDSN